MLVLMMFTFHEAVIEITDQLLLLWVTVYFPKVPAEMLENHWRLVELLSSSSPQADCTALW